MLFSVNFQAVVHVIFLFFIDAPSCAELRLVAPSCALLRRVAPFWANCAICANCAELRWIAPNCAELR
jgi:hypothetical protein